MHDADELFVQVPQGCRPPRQRSTPARSDRGKPLVRGPRKPQARRSEVDGKVTCAVGGLRRERSARSPFGAAFSAPALGVRHYLVKRGTPPRFTPLTSGNVISASEMIR